MLALFLAGFGHGSYLLLVCAGAPFSFLGIVGGTFGCLLQWGLLAILLRTWRRAHVFVMGFLVLHYIAAAIALKVMLEPEDVDFGRLHSMLPQFTLYLVGGFIWYLAGQIAIWAVAIREYSAMKLELRQARIGRVQR